MQQLSKQLQRLTLCFLLLSITGCDTLQNVLDSVDRPRAKLKGVSYTNLSMQGLTLNFDVEIANPYPVPLPLVNMQYDLQSDNRKILSGLSEPSGTIPASGKRTISLPATINFADLLSTLTSIKPGATIPYNANLTFAVDSPSTGILKLPVKKQGNIPIPTIPKVELTKINWDKISLQEATATLELKITNLNKFPIDLNELGLDLSLSDTSVLSTSVNTSKSFTAGGSNTIKIPMSIKPINLGLSLFNTITGKSASYQLKGKLDTKTPFGQLNIPFNQSGKTEFFK